MIANQNKSLFIVAAACCLLPTAVSAFSLSFDGTLTLFAPDGSLNGPVVNNFTGNIEILSGFDGVATFDSVIYFGQELTFHDINMSFGKIGPVDASGLFDWGADTNVPFSIQWNVVANPDDGSFSMTTLDGNGDGIPGIPMLSGPFVGKSWAIDGIASPVPVPAAALLFGSGLLGLVGITRNRKKDIKK